MALTAGTRLGPYEILALIGAGGMGEVYRALDPRMGREVAIKVSAERFSDRFSREVHAVAALNHPNICHLYDVGPDYLVMELVEGHPPKGPLPFETALNYARQIADALEAAHEKGIVHRDLKPANIKITPEGAVKVLDFGLAKLAEPPVSGTNPDHSPTLTLEHATSAGIILGTAGYMPPEQARGKRVDKRADIWAFGVVFYEMLTGEQPFEGETVSDTLAAVLEREPHWERIPAKVRRLLQSCLEKDPRKRLRDIGDVWRLLNEGPAPQAKQVNWLPWIAAAVLAVALGIALWAPWRAAPPAAEVMRFQIPIPENKDVTNLAFAVSPDGRWLAFLVRGPDGLYRHWVRSLDSLEARELPGSETIYDTQFFWSPDSQFIAYDAGGKLKRVAVAVAGGPAQTLCDLPGIAVGGSWNRDGVILVGTIGGGILRVSAAGGAPSPVTELDSSHKGVGNVVPTFLPDGRHFLYLGGAPGSASQVFVGALDVKPAEQSTKPLLASSNGTAYMPSTDAGASSSVGRLLFVREKTLLAQGFDTRHLELVGDAVPVAERVDNFSVSENGVLVYRTGIGQVSQLTWLDRQGKTLSTVGDAGVYNNVALSPDATRAIVSKVGENSQDLWLMDLAHGGSIRFTFDFGVANAAVWSPDGSRIAYSHLKSGGSDLYLKPVGGTKDEELLLRSNELKLPTSWSRDGRFLLYNMLGSKTKGDVFVLSLESRKPVRLLGTDFDEMDGQFSPDGKWIAYQSDESGRNEVYVRPFLVDSAGVPSAGDRSLVSKGGGTTPFWREQGRELFYVAPDRTLMAVAVSNNPAFPFGEPKALFQRLEAITGDVAGDGKRILAALPAAQSTPAPFTVVLNWQAALKK